MKVRVVDFKQEFKHGKATDYVKLAPAGDGFTKVQTWHRVERLRPREELSDRDSNALTNIAMKARWEVIGPAYEAWKTGGAIPETGTPLAAWSGLTADQAKHLQRQSIRTVEDVRDMGEEAAAKLPFPSARRLPQLAAEYLKGADAAAKDQKMAEMQERMDAMAEMLEAQQPKRGRPRKDQEAA